MDKVISLFTQLFDALEDIDSPLRICELILLAVMSHRIRQPKSAGSEDGSAAVASDPDVSVLPAEAPQASAKEKKSRRKELENQLMLDLDLLFSDKNYNDMTESEQARCAALLNILRG